MPAPAALNLSNEVVKMRAEVKRVKVLVIRKLTRQVAALKIKKGTEADLEKNQRRVARLLEEIRELKHLAPDSITKAALQKDISFEKVCQNKEASPSERATARVATHPQFSRRIQSIKKAIEAFKAERTGTAKADKKTQKESKGNIQQKSESEQDGDDEEDMEESGEKNEKEQEGDDGPSQMTQKKDAEEKSARTDSIPAEVVKMRKEVKKLKVLIIRKLTQQITHLKKMKALQGNIDLEEVFQNPESSPLERVTARIATHARFIKKLQDVRDAIEKERTKAEKAEEKNKDAEETMADDGDDESDPDDDEEDEGVEGGTASDGSNEDDDTEDNKKEMDQEQPLSVIKESHVVKPPEDSRPATVVLSSKEKTPITKSKAGVSEQAVPSASLKNIAKMPVSASVVQLPAKSKETPVTKPPPPPSLKQDLKHETKEPENKEVEEESDLESSDEEEEEKEYFDDSTEERFHKQSSLSEESDDDDFFLGKVSKQKKKKGTEPGKDKTSEPKAAAELPDAKEARGTSQDFKMQSVFCSTLSKSSGASQKGKPQGSKPPCFRNQKKHAERDGKPAWFKSQGPGTDRKPSVAGPKAPGQRQIGAAEAKMGKPAFEQQRTQSYKGAPGKPFKPPQHSQQALHPSWEASKKRKEQQSQITAFQGKKIRFDDDD
ncbi:hypothetical protein AOLI_G00302430 [Acnodon oligacanthus]